MENTIELLTKEIERLQGSLLTEQGKNKLLHKALSSTSKELRQQKRVSALFSQNVQHTILLCSKEGQISFASNSIIESLGYLPKKVINTQFFEYIHCQDQVWIRALMADSIRDRVLMNPIMCRVRKSNGTFIWAKMQIKFITNREDDIKSIQITVHDITTEKQNDFKLRFSERNYRKLASNIPNTDVYLFDTSKRFLVADGANMKLQGLDSSDFPGYLLSEVFPQETVNLLDPLFADTLKGVGVSKEVEHLSEYYHYQGVPLLNEMGSIEGGLMVCTNITKRKKEQKAISSITHELEQAMDLADMSHWQYDIIAQEFKFSAKILQLLQLNAEDLIDFNRVVSAFRHDPAMMLREAIYEAKQSGNGFDMELELSTEKKAWVRMIAKSYDGLDEIYIIKGIIQNITATKLDNEQLLRAKAEAEKASMAKAEFLSTMSHEIRTPLNAILGISHVVLQEDPREDQIDNLNALRFSGENLLALINDILDFSKIEAGKINLEKENVDLWQLIGSIEHSMKYLAAEKNISLSVEIDKVVPQVVKGDSIRILQILNNLVGNAIKFTHAGGVKITIDTLEKTDNTVNLRFAVSDSGIGIPGDKFESIFESFTQASEDTTRKFGGTGLGLSITKRLLEMHNSTIEVKSVQGKGSVFSFNIVMSYMKKNYNTVAKKAQTNITGNKSLKDYNILLVEDYDLNILIAGKFFKKWELNYQYATNGKQAVEMTLNNSYDLILMDIHMPIMDGYQASREIRAFNQHIPILALTASSISEVEEKVFENRMNGTITKPFNPKELYGILTSFLETSTEKKSEK